jgi:hypothetical protein
MYFEKILATAASRRSYAFRFALFDYIQQTFMIQGVLTESG